MFATDNPARKIEKRPTQIGWNALLGLVLLPVLIASCVTIPPPKTEFTVAKAAIDAARAVQAVRYSPGNWHQAEEFFRQAKILYNERQYEEAQVLFERARQAAERAENSARLMRQKNGDIL